MARNSVFLQTVLNVTEALQTCTRCNDDGGGDSSSLRNLRNYCFREFKRTRLPSLPSAFATAPARSVKIALVSRRIIIRRALQTRSCAFTRVTVNRLSAMENLRYHSVSHRAGSELHARTERNGKRWKGSRLPAGGRGKREGKEASEIDVITAPTPRAEIALATTVPFLLV